MKKIIALILAVLLISSFFVIPASAAPGNQNFGNVKKISDSDINMKNGDRDAAWDYALAIPVKTHSAEGDGSAEATGTTWVLWSDTAYYFYTEVNDPTPVSLTLADWGVDDGEYYNAWETDSVEIFIVVAGDAGDFDGRTVGNYDDACWQFRIDRNGIPSSYQRSGAWTDDFLSGPTLNKDRYEWAAKVDGNKYYVKHKITMLGAPKPGEMGLQIQINDRLDADDSKSPQVRANETNGSWNVDEYGFVVLVNEPAMVAAALPAPVGNLLKGNLIGAEGGWEGNPATGRGAAFDGDLGTFYDPAAQGNPEHYVGIKVSEPIVLTEIRICPRSGFLDRFEGASIYGFNGDTFDPATATLIWQSKAKAPADGFQIISASDFTANASAGFTSFAYFNEAKHGDVAEIELYGSPAGSTPAEKPVEKPVETPKPQAPKTGDAGIIVLVAIMAAAGIVVFRKKSAVK